MSVTVVGRWQVEATGQGRFAPARQELTSHLGRPTARLSARVLQAIDDPSILLYLSEWEDRASFEHFRDNAGVGTLEAALRTRGEIIICERLLFFGNYTYRAAVTGCAIIDAPLASSDAVRDVMLPDGRWVMHGLPGLVHYTVYREVTHLRRLIFVNGWQSID
ncbi:MAG: antibiotic biosynthesis monooxygenase, partial [Chloroflexota bacterium]